MKKLKLNFQPLKSTEALTRSQLKNVLGGDSGSGCPPDNYACICTDVHGNIGPDLDAYGRNIVEAANNASNYCDSIGWSGANCSENRGC